MVEDTIIQTDECPKEISSKIHNNDIEKRKKRKSSNKTSRKKKRTHYDPQEEARLERIVFGDPIDIIQNLTPAESVRDYKDSKASTNDDSHSQISDTEDISNKKKCPVWNDEDDDDYKIEDACRDQKRRIKGDSIDKSYTQLLRKEYSHIVGTPKWAEVEKQRDESDLSDDEILKHSCHITAPKLKRLPADIIDIKALNAINKQTHNEGPLVTSVEFHPTSTVSLVAGSSGILSIFHADGITNDKLHSIKFENFPVSRARFLNEGNEILASSKFYDHCHSYNLISGKVHKIPLPHNITSMKDYEISPDGKIIAFCGRMGEIHLLTSNSKELIGTMKMNAKCRSLAFTPNGQNLITHGDSDEMYVWDVNSRTCIHRAIDDGCLAGESIAISGNNQFLATGSKQGVVNIYDVNSVMQSTTPKPLKIILNLVTSVTALKFNPSSEILAMASNKMPNAFKMVHLPSFSVFSNFPNNRTIMNRPLTIDFSPSSGYLGISNNTFSALMFKLKYYENY